MAPTPFDARSLEARYAFLDDCPEHLLPQLVTLPVGELSERVAGVLAWRHALLGGQLPGATTWPPPEVGAPVRRALDELGLVRFCKDQPELVDALLADILSAISRQAGELRSEVARQLRELERLERQRMESDEAALAKREKRSPRDVLIDADALRRLREQARAAAASQQRDSDAGLKTQWGERARAWAQISDVFGDLGQMLGRGWDLARGVLQHTGWTDLLRLAELVKQLPQLREIVRSLGRLQASEDAETVAEQIFVPVRRLEEERRQVRTPFIPAETRGVERSGDIARMLPAEAAMLGHPKLRLLWHARRAERALLTYRVEGTELERVLVEREGMEQIDGQRPRPERGPIVAVIDTSGSMLGVPERVAKALVLEAVRTAHAESRRCYLYAYSGPGDVLEHELDLGPDGIGRLLIFLSHSFGGGTDIGAMSAVVRRLDQEDWKKADVLLVSDGEWAAPRAIAESVKQARERGCRFHGVQIGNRGRTGMHVLCEPVHVFQDWAEVGGWG